MKLGTRTKVALAGALWFGIVAAASLPLAMSVHSAPQPGITAGTAGVAKFSAYLFGLPGAVAGLVLANRIARSVSVMASIGLGVLLVVFKDVLAALQGALGGFVRSFSIQAFGESLLNSSFLFLFSDVVSLYGIPFVLGGLAAMAFRAVVRRSRWAEQ
jgi:hypothetical protein